MRVAGTHTDTTTRHAAEAKLREALLQNEQLVRELREALDAGYWQRIEEYLAERTDARFTHGLCPACNDRLLPG